MTDLTATGLPLDNTADTAAEQYDPAHDSPRAQRDAQPL